MGAMNDSSLIFLDANIVMYCLGKEHLLKAPCLRIIEQVRDGQILVCTSTEVQQETLYRYYRQKRQDIGDQAYRLLTDLSHVVYPVTSEDMEQAFSLLHEVHDIEVRDAVHAAVMLNNGLTHILSADDHFDRIAGVTRVDPQTFQS
jgi:predicted nucleic acid-binding protein